MSEGQASTNEFTTADGKTFRVDPTGAAAYRLWYGNKLARYWFGDWGDLVCEGPGAPTQQSSYVREKRAAGTIELQSNQVSPRPLNRSQAEDSVSGILEFIGWAAVIGSIIGGVIIISNSSNYYSSGPEAELGWIVLIAGSIQGLLLVGFSRVVKYTALSAANSTVMVDLLRKAVDDQT